MQDFSKGYKEQFSRQISIKQIGIIGQNKIANAHIVVIGAGGLACPLITNLCSLGIGNIKIFDFDKVSLSNLNRQFLYTREDVGKDKISILNKTIKNQYIHTNFELINTKINKDNIEKEIIKPDIIVLCVDSDQTRMLVNSYAVSNEIALIDAGIKGFYGYVMAVEKNSPCLACHKLEETKEENSIDALAATAGIIASIQASICINLILQMPNPYKNSILQYDGILGEFEKIPLQINPNCSLHK